MKTLILIISLLFTGAAIGQVKISGLPAASVGNDADLMEITQAGASRKLTLELLRAITAAKITDSTLVGRNLLKLENPNAVVYLRINADNTVSALSASDFKTALAFGTSDISGLDTALSGKQAASALLTSIAGLSTVADRGLYFSGTNTTALFTLTSFARTFLDDADASAVRTTLGVVIGTDVQAFNAKLAAVAAATQAADTMFYYTGATTGASTALTAFARTILDDADAATARGTLGLTIGTNVQAFHASLNSIAGLTTSANKGIYTTGSNTYATYDLSTFARTFLDDADAAAVRVTLGAVGTSGDQNVGGVKTFTNGIVSEYVNAPWNGYFGFTGQSGVSYGTAVKAAGALTGPGVLLLPDPGTTSDVTLAHLGTSPQTFLGSRIFNGTSNTLPNQTAATPAHAMNRKLTSELIPQFLPFISTGFHFDSSSGDMSASYASNTWAGGAILTQTPSTPAAWGRARISSFLATLGENAATTLDRSFAICWTGAFGANTGQNAAFDIYIGGTGSETTSGALSGRGLRVTFYDGNITLAVHNGTNEASSTIAMPVDPGSLRKFLIRWDDVTETLSVWGSGYAGPMVQIASYQRSTAGPYCAGFDLVFVYRSTATSPAYYLAAQVSNVQTYFDY